MFPPPHLHILIKIHIIFSKTWVKITHQLQTRFDHHPPGKSKSSDLNIHKIGKIQLCVCWVSDVLGFSYFTLGWTMRILVTKSIMAWQAGVCSMASYGVIVVLGRVEEELKLLIEVRIQLVQNWQKTEIVTSNISLPKRISLFTI